MKDFLYTYLFRLLEVTSWMFIFFSYSHIAGLENYSLIVYPLFLSSVALSFVSSCNTLIINEISKSQKINMSVYYLIILLVLLIFSVFAYINTISIFVVLFFLFSGIRNIEYATYRGYGHTKKLTINSFLVNIAGLIILFFVDDYIGFFKVLCVIKTLEIVFLKFTMPSYVSITRLKKIDYGFFIENRFSYIFLLFPLIIAPLDKGLMIDIFDGDILGFYQLNDQINTGIYTLIMSVIYIRIPEIFSALRNDSKKIIIIKYLKYLIMLPMIFVISNFIIWTILNSELTFDEKIFPILLSSFYKSILSLLALTVTIYLVSLNKIKPVLIILFLVAIFILTIVFIKNLNLALSFIIFISVFLLMLNQLIKFIKTS